MFFIHIDYIFTKFEAKNKAYKSNSKGLGSKGLQLKNMEIPLAFVVLFYSKCDYLIG